MCESMPYIITYLWPYSNFKNCIDINWRKIIHIKILKNLKRKEKRKLCESQKFNCTSEKGYQRIGFLITYTVKTLLHLYNALNKFVPIGYLHNILKSQN